MWLWRTSPVRASASSAKSRISGIDVYKRQILGVVALVYLLPVVGFLLGYFLSEGLAEGVRYAIAIGAAALAFLPSVAYDRHAKKTEALTYTCLLYTSRSRPLRQQRRHHPGSVLVRYQLR